MSCISECCVFLNVVYIRVLCVSEGCVRMKTHSQNVVYFRMLYISKVLCSIVARHSNTSTHTHTLSYMLCQDEDTSTECRVYQSVVYFRISFICASLQNFAAECRVSSVKCHTHTHILTPYIHIFSHPTYTYSHTLHT